MKRHCNNSRRYVLVMYCMYSHCLDRSRETERERERETERGGDEEERTRKCPFLSHCQEYESKVSELEALHSQRKVRQLTASLRLVLHVVNAWSIVSLSTGVRE